MWKTVIRGTLGWGPRKSPGEVGVWAETGVRHTRQKVLWGMTCPRPCRWILVEQVWKPQRRFAQALGSSPEHPKWAEFRVLGCSVLTWPCPFAQSWVITPSGSLPHGTESVTQWNQQSLMHPRGQLWILAHSGASAGGFWMTLRWGCIAVCKPHKLSSCESPGQNWVHFI